MAGALVVAWPAAFGGGLLLISTTQKPEAGHDRSEGNEHGFIPILYNKRYK